MLIKDAMFTIFDLETTGLSPAAGDKIVEIAAMKTDLKGKKEIFHSMVDPQREIGYGAFKVNGITQEMLEGAPVIEDVIDGFLDFAKDTVIVAYNEPFDMGFIRAVINDDALILKQTSIDALVLARRLFKGVSRYNLGTIAAHVGAPKKQEHRALADVELTLAVFKKEIEMLKEQGFHKVLDIENFMKRNIRPVSSVTKERLAVLEKAIEQKQKVDITYVSFWSHDVTERSIMPKKIMKEADRIYVVADCLLKGEERNFRLDGILRVNRRS
jgi:DNA polymerase III epsilon subunit family exonuclease